MTFFVPVSYFHQDYLPTINLLEYNVKVSAPKIEGRMTLSASATRLASKAQIGVIASLPGTQRL